MLNPEHGLAPQAQNRDVLARDLFHPSSHEK